MARAYVELEGGRELRRTLRVASEDLQNLKDIHARVGKIVEAKARSLAPRVSGEMAGTIRSSGTKTAAIVRAGYKRTPYAGPQNYGWPESAAGIKGSYHGGHFVNQAAQVTEPVWLALYISQVNKALDQIKGI